MKAISPALPAPAEGKPGQEPPAAEPVAESDRSRWATLADGMGRTTAGAAAGGDGYFTPPPSAPAGQPLPAGQRRAAERMYGQSFADVRVHADTGATLAMGGPRTLGVAVDDAVYVRSDAYRPGSIRGDLVLAHELAHVAQHRASGPAASESALERQASSDAVRALDGKGSPRSAAASGPLRLNRCEASQVPENLASLDVPGKAALVRRLLAENRYNRNDAVVDVFQAARDANQFVALQSELNMAEVYGSLDDDWTIVRIGALGPIAVEQARMAQARGTIIRDTTREFPRYAELFTLFIFDTTQDDQIRDVLRWLAADNRLKRTVGSMPTVQQRLKDRGINLGDFQDRAQGAGDVLRGLGEGLSGFLGSSPAASEGTAHKYMGRTLDLPEPYHAAAQELDRQMLEQTLTPGNVALGVFDQLTFGIPLGIYGLGASVVSSIGNFAQGDLDAGARDLFPALLVVGTYVGVRIVAGPPPPAAGGAAGAAEGGTLGGPRGGGGRVRFGPPKGGTLTMDQAIMRFAEETQTGLRSLLKAFTEDEIKQGAVWLRKDSRAAAFVEQNGQNGFRKLVDAGGDPTRAAALLAAAAATSTVKAPAAAPAPAPSLEPEPEPAPEPGAAPADEETESSQPSKPFRWAANINGSAAIGSGGVRGALDYKWWRSGSGPAQRVPQVDLGGQTYTIPPGGTYEWHGHHVWPKQYGGADAQPLMTVRGTIHISIIHPSLYAYMRAQGHNVTTHTSDPKNQAFIQRLRSDAALRAQVTDELFNYYALVNTQTDPVIPRDAFARGINYSRKDLGG